MIRSQYQGPLAGIQRNQPSPSQGSITQAAPSASQQAIQGFGSKAALGLANAGIKSGLSQALGGTGVGSALGIAAPAAGAGALTVAAPLVAAAGVGKLFGLFNDGGFVAEGDQQYVEAQIAEGIQMLQEGKITLEDLAAYLSQIGVPPELIQQIIQEVSVLAPQSGEAPSIPSAGPLSQAPVPPTFNIGGVAESASSSPNPVSKVRKKTKQQNGKVVMEEDTAIEFDTDSMSFNNMNLVPPMSDMAKQILS